MRKLTQKGAEDLMKVDFLHSANKKVLEWATPGKKSPLNFANEAECDPILIEDVYSKLGMYEELVSFFWDKITKHLPSDCRWIVFGRAALVNPKNGVIFGFIFSNISFALRLPQEVRNVALNQLGHTKQELFRQGMVDIEDILGKEWVLFYAKEPENLLELCLDAFTYSEKLGNKV